jgi:hypothetical protein
VPKKVLSNAGIGLARYVLRVCVAEVVRSHMRRDPGALDDAHNKLAQRLA